MAGERFSPLFSSNPTWSQTTKSGFRQQIFVMYHSTQVENVESIMRNGFEISTGQSKLLGNGLYVTRDIQKTLPYGNVCFRLLVYPGKSFCVTDKDDPLRYTLFS